MTNQHIGIIKHLHRRTNVNLIRSLDLDLLRHVRDHLWRTAEEDDRDEDWDEGWDDEPEERIPMAVSLCRYLVDTVFTETYNELHTTKWRKVRKIEFPWRERAIRMWTSR